MEVPLDSEEYGCEFHHVHIYVDSLKPLPYYKKVELQLNQLAHEGSFDPFSGGMRFLESSKVLPARVGMGNQVWKELCEKNGIDFVDAVNFSSDGQDFVEQLIVGLGWRITAQFTGSTTRSFLVTSQDARGVKFIVSALDENSEKETLYDHFEGRHLVRFFEQNHSRMGIAVLAFQLPSEEAIEVCFQRYKKLHPELVIGMYEYCDSRNISCPTGSQSFVLGKMKIMEAFAYYETDDKSAVDKGTVLRFVYREGTMGTKEGFGNPQGVLPGLEDVIATFDGTSIPAYSDHWVSNVTDRNSFLKCLEDVLRFTPKVDFNAGVVAAGQARIESTVTGNTAKIDPKADVAAILRDQSQVFLPINNALTSVGHVHLFLEQMGQGVQHLASRVKDLVSFIERVNNYRLMTGRGFSFLNIPLSYYGRLDANRDLGPILNPEQVSMVMGLMTTNQLCSPLGIVKLDITDSEIAAVLSSVLAADTLLTVSSVVKAARYNNLYSLLKDHFSEETYLQIVRNKILVDIQANDVLFQIFTCNILQRNAGEEAPFLEFIQRVCSEKKTLCGECAPIKPGCGGFGIRNFLTLFLSIEVSKAMHQAESASSPEQAQSATRKVELFTKQLDESNPILTAISDAMTAEGDALEELLNIKKSGGQLERILELESIAKDQARLKQQGNAQLQQLSKRYSALMSEIK